MTKIILTGPPPTPEEVADQLGLTYRDRISVNKILRNLRSQEPRIKLLPVSAKRRLKKIQGSEHARSNAAAG